MPDSSVGLSGDSHEAALSALLGDDRAAHDARVQELVQANARPYYQDDHVTLYHGDCRNLWSGVAANVLITDPPYGVGLGSHQGADERRRGFHVLRRDEGYASYEDSPENFKAVIVPTLEQMIPMFGRAAIFMGIPMAWQLPPPAALGGVFLPTACGRSTWGFSSIAHCLLYVVAPDLHKGAKATAFRSTQPTAVDGMGHPCAKPVEWMRWAVNLASRPGEVVFDPFAGSGSTLRAAKDLGRKAVGIEIEERYCEMAVRRCAQEVLDVV
jgi:site-specific DNA-methyltransferase (adenine-specific)